MSELLPFFGNFTFTIIAFVVALLIIVAVHEFGHYIVGRWTGIHAEVFSLGFGPMVWSGFDRFGTRWQIAAIPLGGYVRFLGDANAASAGPATRGGRGTMLGAPLWARSATVAAGPFANFIFSFVVFAGLLMTLGVPSTPLTLRTVPDLPPSYTQGLRAGDEVLAIAGQDLGAVDEIGAVLESLPLTPVLDYKIRRDGTEMTVAGPYPSTTLVQAVNHDSAAHDAGILPGDVIESIDGEPVWRFDQMVQIVTASEGRALVLNIWRAGETLQITLTPRRVDYPQPDGSFVTRWLMGVVGGNFFDPNTEFPGVGTAVTGAAYQVWYIIKISLSGLWHMIVGTISTCNLSSPVGIAQASGAMAAAGPVEFIQFLGLLSTAVGLLNLFPIPVLDGGHLVFHAYEAVTGKPPNDRVLRFLIALGLAVILGMMALGLANDIFLCP